jgi:hypothetical protein
MAWNNFPCDLKFSTWKKKPIIFSSESMVFHTENINEKIFKLKKRQIFTKTQ